MNQKQNSDSNWMKLVKYINSFPVGYVISRKQLMEFLYDKDHGLFGRISETTMDQYRRTFTWLGYLKEVTRDGYIMKGKYEIVLAIPEDLPSSVAYKEKRTKETNNNGSNTI